MFLVHMQEGFSWTLYAECYKKEILSLAVGFSKTLQADLDESPTTQIRNNYGVDCFVS